MGMVALADPYSSTANTMDTPLQTFEDEVEKLLHLLPLGTELARNRNLLQAWFRWSVAEPGKRTYDTLATKYGITRTRVSQLIDDFAGKVRKYNFGKEKQPE